MAVVLVAVLLGYLLATDWPRLVGRVTSPPAATGDSTQKPVTAGRIRVIDGDTIDLDRNRVRLVGFNAPETWSPSCAAEAALGQRAKKRLRELVASSRLAYRPVACSCPSGTEGTERCNHGRACGSLLADGRDVGDILVAERLAAPYSCGRTSCPPLPRPWCG